MRRISLSFVILIALLCFVTQVFAVAPAPFEKVKEIALKAPVNSQGNYIIEISFNENGEGVVLILGYIPSHGYIGIGLSTDKFVYEYNEKTQTLGIWTPMGRFPVQEKDRELFFEKVFKIFRYLVSHQWA